MIKVVSINGEPMWKIKIRKIIDHIVIGIKWQIFKLSMRINPEGVAKRQVKRALRKMEGKKVGFSSHGFIVGNLKKKSK